LLQSLL